MVWRVHEFCRIETEGVKSKPPPLFWSARRPRPKPPTRRLSKLQVMRLYMRSPLSAAAVSASFLCVLILRTWRRAKRSLAAPDLLCGSNVSDGAGISTSSADYGRHSGVGGGGSCAAAPATTGGATADGIPVIPSWTTGELVRLSAPASGLCLTVVVEERRSRHRGAVAISLPGR